MKNEARLLDTLQWNRWRYFHVKIVPRLYQQISVQLQKENEINEKQWAWFEENLGFFGEGGRGEGDEFVAM